MFHGPSSGDSASFFRTPFYKRGAWTTPFSPREKFMASRTEIGFVSLGLSGFSIHHVFLAHVVF